MIVPRRRGPGVPARALNGLVALWVGRLGLPAPRVRMLRVHGRRTGRLRSTPVLVLHLGRFRYLVAPRGETEWARNLRAAGWGELMRGRRVERVRGDRGGGRRAHRGGGRRTRGGSAGSTGASSRPAAATRPSASAQWCSCSPSPSRAPRSAPRAGYRVSEARAAPRRRPGARDAAEGVRRRPRRNAGQGRHRLGAEARPDAAAAPWPARWGAARRSPARCASTPGGTPATSRPTAASSCATPRGCCSTYWEGRGLAVNPVATTGRWQDLNAGLTPEQLAEALLPFAVTRRAGGRHFLLWEYYDVPDRPSLVRPGASGMAQGRIAQLMSRAYNRTGEASYARAAAGALAAFTVPVSRWRRREHRVGRLGRRRALVRRARLPGRGAVAGRRAERVHRDAAQPRGPAPSYRHGRSRCGAARPRSGSGHARRAPRRPAEAKDIVARGERTLARYLPLHDTGSWSLYGLATPGWGWRTHVADAGYHCYHVTLLEPARAPGARLRVRRRRLALGRLRPAARGIDCSLAARAGSSRAPTVPRTASSTRRWRRSRAPSRRPSRRRPRTRRRSVGGGGGRRRLEPVALGVGRQPVEPALPVGPEIVPVVGR